MTTFAEIARLTSVVAAANAYADCGLSIIPVSGKRASVGWTEFQRRKPTRAEIAWWHNRGLLQGVGVVCGRVSRNLIVIDLDGLNAVTTFQRAFPQLAETFTVQTGSGRGAHLYFWLEQLPNNRRVMNIPGGGNIELRGNGCYVVAPPSVHPETGHAYVVGCPYPPMRLTSLRTVEAWLEQLAGRARAHTPAPSSPGNLRANRFCYAESALKNEIGAIRASNVGNRNDRLNRAAYSLGQLIADGQLQRTSVEENLLAAAAAVGLPERESLATIRSGIDAGMKNPRSLRGRKHG